MKTAIKITAFIAVLLLLLWYLMQVFTYPKSVANTDSTGDFSREKFNTFYKQDKNTIDCVFLGSSGTDRYWLPAFAWHDNGLATYSLTTPSQNIAFTENLMKEVLKTQDVKLFVVDLRLTVGSLSRRSSPIVRRVTDNMRISPNWIDTIMNSRKVITENGGKTERLLSFLFTPYKYHSMWNTMTADDYIELFPEDEYMGYFEGDFVYRTKKQPATKFPIESMDIPEENKEIIDELTDYCKSIDAEIVFVSTPISANKKIGKSLKGAAEYVKSKGFEVYDFNTQEMYDELDWDFKTDMYDPRHANFKGAVKFTDWWSRILTDKYGLEDHRNDPDTACYSKWDRAYDLIMKTAEKKMPDVYKELA